MISSSSNHSYLTIHNLQLADLQLYWCVANDSVHWHRDVSLQLTEEAGLYVVGGASTTPVAVQFQNGMTLMLACVTRGGTGTEVAWYQGKSRIGNGTSVGVGQAVVIARGNQSVLNVGGVGTSEAGLYSCAVSNPVTGLESRREFRVTITGRDKQLLLCESVMCECDV